MTRRRRHEPPSAAGRRRPERATAPRVVLRINNAESAEFEQDLAMLSATGVCTVMLPKTESPAQTAHVRGAGSLDVLALIESAGVSTRWTRSPPRTG